MTGTFLPIEPPAYFRIKTVHSFAELVGTPFADGVNMLCWPRARLILAFQNERRRHAEF